mmetsp:Transcript_16050/g.50312  ORF Transcript_16050/g.50312 Transcript_16050/m.50312 type:complete len:263 (-) Transcript_16050:341-1129(-)
MRRRRTTWTVLVVTGASSALKPTSPPPVLRVAQKALRVTSARVDQIRCPFWRRRFSDVIDAGESVVRFLAARHKSLPVPVASDDAIERRRHRSSEEVAADIEREFTAHRYYVTGRLDASLYAADCLFDAPDPDMPVRGAAKFADALSGLFDSRRSRCDLVEIRVSGRDEVKALWRLEGVLRLPWRPTITPFIGETTYTLDDDGLVASHLERWSCSVFDAFLSAVLAPDLLDRHPWLPQRPPPPPPLDHLILHPDQARDALRG